MAIQGPLAVLGAISAAKGLQDKPGNTSVQRGTNINMPRSQDPMQKFSAMASFANTASNLNQKNAPNEQQEIKKVKNYNPIEKRLDNYDYQKNPNEMLQLYSQAEQQLNQMPQEQRMIYGPPLYEGMIRTYQDYKTRGVV